jgi:hypothetical protein
VTGKSYELSLEGMDVPEGQISFAQLGALATNIQDLVKRIGRQLDDRGGPGRTPISLGRATEIRLTALKQGSTLLDFEVGDPETIDLPDETHALLAERFEEIVEHVAQNHPPAWADHLVGEATMRVVNTLRAIGATDVKLFRVTDTVRQIVDVNPATLDPSIWEIEAPQVLETSGRDHRVSGRLEAVDLVSHRFRVRDDTGHAIRLENVADADEVGRLVGSRVIATGEGFRDARGTLVRLDGAAVVSQELSPGVDDRPAVRSNAPHVETDLGFSDDELDDFLRDLRA